MARVTAGPQRDHADESRLQLLDTARQRGYGVEGFTHRPIAQSRHLFGQPHRLDVELGEVRQAPDAGSQFVQEGHAS
jgi:hypothetical protein